MKKRQTVPRKLALTVIGIITVFILLIIFQIPAYAQKSAKQYHIKLQKEYSYETRLKANKSFTLASAKDNLRTAKKKARNDRKQANKLAKVRAKREQIASIKP